MKATLVRIRLITGSTASTVRWWGSLRDFTDGRRHGKRLEFVPSCPGIAVRRTASLPLAYVPGTRVFLLYRPKKRAWMAGTSPAITALEGLLGGSLSRNCCP